MFGSISLRQTLPYFPFDRRNCAPYKTSFDQLSQPFRLHKANIPTFNTHQTQPSLILLDRTHLQPAAINMSFNKLAVVALLGMQGVAAAVDAEIQKRLAA